MQLLFIAALLHHLAVMTTVPDDNCLPSITISGQNKVCSGTLVKFEAVVTNPGTNGNFTWKKNGLVVHSGIDPFYNDYYNDGDKIICSYSSHTACGTDATVSSTEIKMQVTTVSPPTITVSNEDSLICEHDAVHFKTKSSYVGGTPSYNWTVNGVDVGETRPDYTTDSLTNGSQVKCFLTVTYAACPAEPVQTASSLTIYVYPSINPKIEIAATKTDICRGESVSFTATANGGYAPSFLWEVNGIPTGDSSYSYQSSSLNDDDVISCTITVKADSRCKSTTTAPSNDVVMNVRDYTDPKITIAAPVLEACAGSPLSFNATVWDTGEASSYSWLVNGKPEGGNTATFVSDNLANGDSVNCLFKTTISGCPFSATALSNAEYVTIFDLPDLSFDPSDTSILAGEQVQLKPVVGNTVNLFHWAPASALQDALSLSPYTIPLLHDMSYTLTVSDQHNCVAKGNIKVHVLQRLYMPNAFTPNGDHLNDVFRIPSGTSIELNTFSIYDRWGNIVFTTHNLTEGWDGTLHGQPLESGIFIFTVSGIFNAAPFTSKGTVLLVR